MKIYVTKTVIQSVRFMIDKTLSDWFIMNRVTQNIINYSDGTCYIKNLNKNPKLLTK